MKHGILLSHEMKEMSPFAELAWTSVESYWVTNVRESGISYDITYRSNLHLNTKQQTSLTETQSQIEKANLWLQKGKVSGRGINLEFEIGIPTLKYRK